jgi:hypothetical protein
VSRDSRAGYRQRFDDVEVMTRVTARPAWFRNDGSSRLAGDEDPIPVMQSVSGPQLKETI